MPERILVRGVNWIGDAVMTMPALRAIRHANRDAHITLLVNPLVATLFERDPCVNEIALIEKHHKSIAGYFEISAKLRGMKFDRAILLQNAFEAALITFMARIPRRIGYGRDGRSLLLTDAIKYHNEDRTLHHIDYYLELLRHAGMDAAPSKPWLYLGIDEREAGRKRLAGLRPPVIGINPGASFGSAKQWLPERFAALARRVIDEMGGSVALFGGPNEVPIADEITRLIGPVNGDQFMAFAGKTTVRELCGLISALDVLVSNDSGPMHIGIACKTPLVAIFGSTSAELTGPRGAGSIVIKHPQSCSPCFRRTCDKPNIPCMTAIEVNEVYASVKKMLPTERAVFFDRDGTLNEDTDYPSRWEDIRIFDDIGSIRRLRDAGYKLVGVTNQSGIARGKIRESFVNEVNRLFMDKHGFDAFYHCPHHPDEGCTCRKPEPEMVMRARIEHGIDLRRSWVVGDKDVDMLLGRAAGCRTVLVRTGKQQSSQHADVTVNTLAEAVSAIASGV